MLKHMDELQKLWDASLVKAVENYKSNKAIKKSTDKNGGKYSIRKNFYKEFDAWDKKNSNITFTIGKTSEALKSINMKEQEIQKHSSMILSELNKHSEVTIETFRNIPELLENPVIVQFSDAIDPNKKRTNKWLSLNGLQLPVGENQYGSIRKITYSDGKVKVQNSNNLTPVQLALQKAGVIDSYGNIISKKSDSDTEKLSIRRRNDAYTALGEMKTLKKRNQKLEQDVAELRQLLSLQSKLTHGNELNPRQLRTAADIIRKRANSTYSTDDITKRIGELYRWIAKGEDFLIFFMTKISNSRIQH